MLLEPRSVGRDAVVLLTTKLTLPRVRQEYVARTRLVERLHAGLRVPLTLVSAPAGFGKSTLVAAGMRQAAMQVAWVSLYAGDNDAVRFWRYVLAALEQARAGLGAPALALLHTAQPPRSAATRFAWQHRLVTAASDMPDDGD